MLFSSHFRFYETWGGRTLTAHSFHLLLPFISPYSVYFLLHLFFLDLLFFFIHLFPTFCHIPPSHFLLFPLYSPVEVPSYSKILPLGRLPLIFCVPSKINKLAGRTTKWKDKTHKTTKLKKLFHPVKLRILLAGGEEAEKEVCERAPCLTNSISVFC